jgi:hypothetical protein
MRKESSHEDSEEKKVQASLSIQKGSLHGFT